MLCNTIEKIKILLFLRQQTKHILFVSVKTENLLSKKVYLLSYIVKIPSVAKLLYMKI